MIAFPPSCFRIASPPLISLTWFTEVVSCLMSYKTTKSTTCTNVFALRLYDGHSYPSIDGLWKYWKYIMVFRTVFLWGRIWEFWLWVVLPKRDSRSRGCWVRNGWQSNLRLFFLVRLAAKRYERNVFECNSNNKINVDQSSWERLCRHFGQKIVYHLLSNGWYFYIMYAAEDSVLINCLII